MMRTLAVFALAVACIPFHEAASAADASQPNILLILMDDMGIGDLSCMGNPVFETPQIDRLSRESVRFENFFVNASCSPTRAALMTGRYFVDAGVWGVHGGREYLHTDEVTLGQALQRGGYATGLFGKWHLGKSEDTKPHRRGFDESVHLVGRLYADTNPIVESNGVRETPKGWSVDLVTEWTKDFIQRKQAEGKPWFAMASYPQIHTQWTAKREYIERYKMEGRSEGFELLAGYVAQTDEGVGRLIEFITQSELEKNTIIVYLHDNGPINRMSDGSQFINEEEAADRNAMNLRGLKGQMWDNGVRSPLFVRFPGGERIHSVKFNAHVMDLLPTLCELAGAEIPIDTPGPLVGRSLEPLLDSGDEATWPDRYLMCTRPTPTWGSKPYTSSGMHKAMPTEERSRLRYDHQGALSIRDQRFKLVRTRGEEVLFDINNDSSEKSDVSAKYPEQKSKMSAAMRAWFEKMIASPRCFAYPISTIGLPGQKRSRVHMASAFEENGVSRGSEGIQEWDESGDQAKFKIRVEEPGTYSILLNSSVKRNSSVMKSRFRIEIADQTIEGTLGQLKDDGTTKGHPANNGVSLAPGEYVLSIKLIEASSPASRLHLNSFVFDRLERLIE